MSSSVALPPLPLTNQSWLCMAANTVPGCSGLNEPRGAWAASAASGCGKKGWGLLSIATFSARDSMLVCIRTSCGRSAAATRPARLRASAVQQRRWQRPAAAAQQGGRCLPRLTHKLDRSPVPPRCRIDVQTAAAATEQAPRSRPRRNTGGNAFAAAWTKFAGGCRAAARTRGSRGARNAWAGVLVCSTPLLVGRAVASMSHMARGTGQRGSQRLTSAGRSGAAHSTGRLCLQSLCRAC